MARQHVDRDTIAEAAYRVAEEHGVAGLGIRSVAEACGVSVGTIYNYFPTKDDLVLEVISTFWRNAFRDDVCRIVPGERFDCFVSRMAGSMASALAEFRSDWLPQTRALSMQGRDEGKMRESEAFAHMRMGLLAVLEADSCANPSRIGINASELVAFVLESVIASLSAGDVECRALVALLGAALYDDDAVGSPASFEAPLDAAEPGLKKAVHPCAVER